MSKIVNLTNRPLYVVFDVSGNWGRLVKIASDVSEVFDYQNKENFIISKYLPKTHKSIRPRRVSFSACGC